MLITLLALGALIGVYFFLFHSYKMPQIKLSNGETVMVFQGMIHIGLKSYYLDVQEDLKNSLKNPHCVVLYEGMGSKLKEDNKKFFKSLLGANINLSNLYTILAKTLGLVNQKTVLSRETYGKGINADLTAGQLNTLIAEHGDKLSPLLSFEEEDVSLYSMRTEIRAIKDLVEYPIFRWALKKLFIGILNYNKNVLYLFKKEKSLFKDIIGLPRSKRVLEEMKNNPSRKYYVVYGYGHFKEILELLLKEDPRWKIVKKVDYTAIK